MPAALPRLPARPAIPLLQRHSEKAIAAAEGCSSVLDYGLSDRLTEWRPDLHPRHDPSVSFPGLTLPSPRPVETEHFLIVAPREGPRRCPGPLRGGSVPTSRSSGGSRGSGLPTR